MPNRAIAAICLAAIIAAACASPGDALRRGPSGVPLQGMVYDFESRPVADAEVLIDGKLRARSDANGRFSLGELRYGAYRVELRKEGYESSRFAADYLEPTQILYVKLRSARQLLLQAEKEAAARSWAEAMASLDRVEALGRVDPAARYLRAAILYRRGEAVAAKAILEALLAEGVDEPYVRLFLADILQYRLSDPLAAQGQLEKYLEARSDPDAERRLQELRAMPGE